jgi:hypothetical protein
MESAKPNVVTSEALSISFVKQSKLKEREEKKNNKEITRGRGRTGSA